MKKDSKTRLFEVMGRLDKTFKPKLNEDFEQPNPVAFKQPEMGDGTTDIDEPKEQTVEEKYEELKAKVEELYGMIHGEETEDDSTEDLDIDSVDTDEELSERKKWNFEKKKGEKDDDESAEHEKSETSNEENDEKEKGDYEFGKKKAVDESKPKIPVANIAKVGK